jgi:hypothetical protein
MFVRAAVWLFDWSEDGLHGCLAILCQLAALRPDDGIGRVPKDDFVPRQRQEPKQVKDKRALGPPCLEFHIGNPAIVRVETGVSGPKSATFERRGQPSGVL